MTGRQLRMTTSSTAGQRLIVEGRVFFALCAMPFFPALLRCRFCVYVYCVLTNSQVPDLASVARYVAKQAPRIGRGARGVLACTLPFIRNMQRRGAARGLSSAFDGGRLQSLLQTPGVMLPRRGGEPDLPHQIR